MVQLIIHISYWFHFIWFQSNPTFSQIVHRSINHFIMQSSIESLLILNHMAHLFITHLHPQVRNSPRWNPLSNISHFKHLFMHSLSFTFHLLNCLLKHNTQIWLVFSIHQHTIDHQVWNSIQVIMLFNKHSNAISRSSHITQLLHALFQFIIHFIRHINLALIMFNSMDRHIKHSMLLLQILLSKSTMQGYNHIAMLHTRHYSIFIYLFIG